MAVPPRMGQQWQPTWQYWRAQATSSLSVATRPPVHGTLAAWRGCRVVNSLAGNGARCCLPMLSAKYYGMSVTSQSSPTHARSDWRIFAVLGIVTAVAGVVVVLLSVSAPRSHVPGVSVSPAPTSAATPTPTVGATSAAHAPPTPIQLILPSSIAITVNGGSGGLPAWGSWLGPIGGFLTGIGALGGLVAFRRRKEQREEDQTASRPSSR